MFDSACYCVAIAAYLVSIFVGGLSARYFVDFLHAGIDKNYNWKRHRLLRLDWSLGIVERVITTTLVVAAPKMVPAFVGGWVALKFAANWQQRKGNEDEAELHVAQKRLSSLIGSAISLSIAVLCGLWINHDALTAWVN